MNLNFIQKNKKIIYIIAIVLLLLVFMLSVQGFRSLSPSINSKNIISVPNGVPVINKSKFKLSAINYIGKNFSIHYVPNSKATGNVKGDRVYVHINGINFLKPKTVLNSVKTKTQEAKNFLLNYGINPNSKNIIYTY